MHLMARKALHARPWPDVSVALPAAARELVSIKERGKLSAAHVRPISALQQIDEQNQIVSFDIDIANEVAKRLCMKRGALTTAWDRIVPGLMANRHDPIVGSTAIPEEREKAVDFVGSYYWLQDARLYPYGNEERGNDLQDTVARCFCGGRA
ncbi:MAG: transporter substrate-binding domain-containing protein [Mesorhizobium sp.]|uniref:Solute-binding protein family 3/N-terminal domain-containing protein n=1 Tax=Mesorhizobium mediterraneum TaxID=43617 RepID=A0AB36QZS1_9HYPH|nr:hypothetical protein CIT25_33500 [Mesorhizobium mediterraneum]RWN28916.1 MAG: transporter substrate-binding domain-containing protein [Mesorhizobium sp.]